MDQPAYEFAVQVVEPPSVVCTSDSASTPGGLFNHPHAFARIPGSVVVARPIAGGDETAVRIVLQREISGTQIVVFAARHASEKDRPAVAVEHCPRAVTEQRSPSRVFVERCPVQGSRKHNVLNPGAIALCSSSKHWVIFEFWGLLS
jgi:hypothetical protein